MAVNQYYNKIIINGETKIDLTLDTVTADKLADGITAHDKTGAVITGTNKYDANTSDGTATSVDILATKTAYVKGAKVTGTMVNNGAATGSISSKEEQYTIRQGYHDGSGKVGISATEQAKIIGSNIRQGITILGIEGTMSGTEGASAQAKSITPTFTSQTIRPDSPDYNYLSEVTVEAIPISEVDNAAGGKTVTVG